MMKALGFSGGPRKGRRIPDILITKGDALVIVEVGRYDPNKWGSIAVIWITFQNLIFVFNANGNAFVGIIVAEINHILNGGRPTAVSYQGLNRASDRIEHPAEDLIDYGEGG
jgi:hypothetical protein